MSRYEIAFAGELVPGANLDQVKENLARLFHADEQRVALLLSGRRVVIRQGLDHTSAEKYRDAMARAGAIAYICEMDVEEIELAPPPGSPPIARAAAPVAAPAPAAAAAPVPAAAPVSVPAQAKIPAPPVAESGFAPLVIEPRDEYMAAFVDVQAPDFGVAPAGADLQDPHPEVRPPQLDLSALSVAPPGVDLGELPRPKGAPVPDISHLKLAD